MAPLKSTAHFLAAFFAATAVAGTALANPVLQAARSGDVAALEAALPEGASVDPKTLERPLFFAAQSGHAEVVALLLSRGANPDVALDFGSPLKKAARGNHVSIVKALLEAGADPNLAAGDLEQAPLHDATERGAMEAAILLLDHGADVNARDRWGVPPIHLAVIKQRPEMAALLTERGAAPLPTEPIAPGELDAADRELGRVAAVGCTQCHTVEPATKPSGIHNPGPPLTNVMDREKASFEGYGYSGPMKDLSGTWTAEELNQFIADPPGVLPGTDMALVPELTRAERIALIAYLRELGASN